jgi:hypothetical protein
LHYLKLFEMILSTCNLGIVLSQIKMASYGRCITINQTLCSLFFITNNDSRVCGRVDMLCFWLTATLFTHHFSCSRNYFQVTNNMIEQIVNVLTDGYLRLPSTYLSCQVFETPRHLLWSFHSVKGQLPYPSPWTN